MISMGNSMFDCQVEKRPDSDEIKLSRDEEEKIMDSSTQLEQFRHLGINPNGYKQRRPTKWNDNPQQTHETFEDCGITVSSRFDSGNLYRVKKISDTSFDLYISADGKPYVKELLYKGWFYFSITGVKPSTTLTFTIRNMKNQTKLYAAGMRPVFKTTSKDGKKVIVPWRRIPSKPVFSYEEDENFINGEKEKCTLRWTFPSSKNSDNITYFAYTYPSSMEEITGKLDEMEIKLGGRKNVYFHRELLTYSREGRNQEMVTVSSLDGINEDEEREEYLDGLFPEHSGSPEERPLKFYDKKIIFLSSRVHPGETGASHMLNGFLDVLMDAKNPHSRSLLKNFVFKIVPAMNPDGIYRGYYRLDTFGHNLNREYLDPDPLTCPTTFSVKNILIQLAETDNLHMYVDFHAHASKKGMFCFGNALKGEQQVDNVLFARLMSLNCLNFDMTECSFSDKIMKKVDKKGESREGTGRVAIYKDTGWKHWYTLECNYHTGKRLTIIPPKFNKILGKGEAETPVTDSTSSIYSSGMWPPYNIEILEDVGNAFAFAILDMVNDNPVSRLPLSRFKNLEGVRADVENTISKPATGRKRFGKKRKATGAKPPPMKVKINSKKTSTASKKEGMNVVFYESKKE